MKNRKKRPRVCQRCGAHLTGGFCTDDTCPFSDHRQNCPIGWVNHPDAPVSRDNVCHCGGRIKAEVHSDDRVFEVSFNAIPWFQQAEAEEVLDLAVHGWGGDYAADVVAELMEDHVHDIAEMFRYLERIHGTHHACGFESHVDEDSAMEWLKIHRPDVAEFVDEFGKARAGRDGDGVHPQAATKIVTESAVAELGCNPEQPHTIVLPCFDIIVRLTGAEPGHSRPSLAGEITSSLHKGDSGTDDDSDYEAAIDGIESLVLAHACAGVDIAAPTYIAGIQTAVEAASNHL